MGQRFFPRSLSDNWKTLTGSWYTLWQSICGRFPLAHTLEVLTSTGLEDIATNNLDLLLFTSTHPFASVCWWIRPGWSLSSCCVFDTPKIPSLAMVLGVTGCLHCLFTSVTRLPWYGTYHAASSLVEFLPSKQAKQHLSTSKQCLFFNTECRYTNRMQRQV